jgi:hypothetical protein
VDEPDVVPQTKPLDVTADPPSAVIVPPLIAELPVIEDGSVVDEIVGIFNVVN